MREIEHAAPPPAASDLFGEYGAGVTCASAVILLAAIASIDKLTGFDLRLSILYLLPVAIVTWAAGRAWGFAMSAAAIATWLVLENLDAPVYVADPERGEVLYGNKQFRETLAQNPYDALAQYPAKECRIRWPDGRRVVLRILADR
jgi:hypothetical protein